MLASMPSRMVTEWMAYERVDGPLGGIRGDYHAALTAAVTAWGFHSLAGRRGSRRPRFEDFVFDWDQQPTGRLTGEELVDQIRVVNRRFGGKEVTRNGDTRRAPGRRRR